MIKKLFSKKQQPQEQHPPAFDVANVFANAMQQHQSGQLSQAEILYRQILQSVPNHVDSLHFLGVLMYQTGQHQAAVELISKAVELEPSSSAIFCNLGLVWQALGHLDAAAENYQKALTLQPNFVQAYFNLGNICHAQGKLDDAIENYQQVIVFNPNFAVAYNALGLVFQAQNKLDAAVKCYQQAITIQPDFFEAHYNLGNAFVMQNNSEAAINSYRHVLAFKPDHLAVYNNLGYLLKEEGRIAEAIDCYQNVIKIAPTDAIGYFNLAVALYAQNALLEARQYYQKAIKLKPDYSEAYYNLANVFKSQNQLEAAIENFQQAISFKSDYVNAYRSLGVALQERGDLKAAYKYIQHAISLKPEYADAHNDLGVLLIEQKKLDSALTSFQQAISLKPDYADAYNNLATVLQKLGRVDDAIKNYNYALAINPNDARIHCSLANALELKAENILAIEHYQKALTLNPNLLEAVDCLLHRKLHFCDWSSYEQLLEKSMEMLKEGRHGYRPFSFLAISDSAEYQLMCAKVAAPKANFPLWKGEHYQHDKIRIAYLSADFHTHATAYLMVELFELHDKTKFETIAISFGVDDKSEMRGRLKCAFNQFIEVSDKSDYEVAILLKKLEVDIAVDLKGYTTNMRPEILAYRPAPIQVNYLGYPGTMGVEYIDYIIADKFLISKQQQIYYTEKVVYLPDSYQVNDSQRKISSVTLTRAEVGLPETGFVFCCFNNNYKITPVFFDVWMRLLTQIEGSVLWLLQDNPWVAFNLKKEAEYRGIAAERLVFAPRMKLEQHLARHKLADVFLDTLPYNSHTTASDALWAGLPVLTCMGNAFAGRVAGSLLNAVGLPELVTNNLEEYEALALKLATNSELLTEIKTKLAKNRTTYPLFNTNRFRQHIEAAYMTMWEKQQRGESPASFEVPVIEKAE